MRALCVFLTTVFVTFTTLASAEPIPEPIPLCEESNCEIETCYLNLCICVVWPTGDAIVCAINYQRCEVQECESISCPDPTSRLCECHRDGDTNLCMAEGSAARVSIRPTRPARDNTPPVYPLCRETDCEVGYCTNNVCSCNPGHPDSFLCAISYPICEISECDVITCSDPMSAVCMCTRNDVDSPCETLTPGG